ncbi:MAG: Pyridoxamine 5-phosphate oxidase [Frankiales bacterium]|nr:Pyridoxamine 5-phosphate oxidase [Frankiales bacterium]
MLELQQALEAGAVTPRPTSRQLVALSEAEALQLVASSAVARIAYLLDDEICVIPVNFHLDGRDVFIRTSDGSELLAAARAGASVTFQSDGISDWSHTGWSVLLVGHLAEVTDVATVQHVVTQLQPWTDGRAQVVRLTAARVSGRRILGAAGGVHVVSHR